MFRKGDIVEAQVTAMMVPMRGGTFKMIAVLRCLTLLDSTYSLVSQHKHGLKFGLKFNNRKQ